jgi:hypothetical protein
MDTGEAGKGFIQYGHTGRKRQPESTAILFKELIIVWGFYRERTKRRIRGLYCW